MKFNKKLIAALILIIFSASPLVEAKTQWPDFLKVSLMKPDVLSVWYMREYFESGLYEPRFMMPGLLKKGLGIELDQRKRLIDSGMQTNLNRRLYDEVFQLNHEFDRLDLPMVSHQKEEQVQKVHKKVRKLYPVLLVLASHKRIDLGRFDFMNPDPGQRISSWNVVTQRKMQLRRAQIVSASFQAHLGNFKGFLKWYNPQQVSEWEALFKKYDENHEELMKRVSKPYDYSECDQSTCLKELDARVVKVKKILQQQREMIEKCVEFIDQLD